jgi:hypothetical protein
MTPPPVLDYQEPPPDGSATRWAVTGGLLGVVWVLAGVAVALLFSYRGRAVGGVWFLTALLAEGLALAGLVALVRPRRHPRAFILGVVAGCAVGVLIDGVCFLS